LFTPPAPLFDDRDEQLTTHFFSPNPIENGIVVRAAWQDSRDTSIAWGRVIESSDDPHFVNAGAIPWLRIEKAGAPRSNRSGTRGRSKKRIVAGAIAGSVGGFFAGGFLGAHIEGDRCDCDDPGVRGFLIGAPIGAVAGGIFGAKVLF
jgi:hypothetical protein